jgi:hypothetical protein
MPKKKTTHYFIIDVPNPEEAKRQLKLLDGDRTISRTFALLASKSLLNDSGLLLLCFVTDEKSYAERLILEDDIQERFCSTFNLIRKRDRENIQLPTELPMHRQDFNSQYQHHLKPSKTVTRRTIRSFKTMLLLFFCCCTDTLKSLFTFNLETEAPYQIEALLLDKAKIEPVDLKVLTGNKRLMIDNYLQTDKQPESAVSTQVSKTSKPILTPSKISSQQLTDILQEYKQFCLKYTASRVSKGTFFNNPDHEESMASRYPFTIAYGTIRKTEQFKKLMLTPEMKERFP